MGLRLRHAVGGLAMQSPSRRHGACSRRVWRTCDLLIAATCLEIRPRLRASQSACCNTAGVEDGRYLARRLS
eukprot:900670-Prymnesium_polylepis.1